MFNRFLFFLIVVLGIVFFFYDTVKSMKWLDFGFIAQKEQFQQERVTQPDRVEIPKEPLPKLSTPQIPVVVITPPKVAETTPLVQPTPLPKEKKSDTNRSKTSKKPINPLTKLLKEHRFYDALALYLDSSIEQSKAYQIELENYLNSIVKDDPTKALPLMYSYLDEVPQSKIIDTIIESHWKTKAYKKSIALLIKKRENYISDEQDTVLSQKIKRKAHHYIEQLIKDEEYTTLFIFLEEMINYGEYENFYQFKLAEIYIKLNKTEEALPLIETLQWDDIYGEKVKHFMQQIEQEKRQTRYQYAIPLQKYGHHFIVEVALDGISLTLLLDTGASYIFIDEHKAERFEVLRRDLVMHTAGGDIAAKLCLVKSLEVGNLHISNIKVTVSKFDNQQFDGLLGMNFFQRFVFHIDQEKSILYLNPKKTSK